MECRETGEFAHRETTRYEQQETFNQVCMHTYIVHTHIHTYIHTYSHRSQQSGAGKRDRGRGRVRAPEVAGRRVPLCNALPLCHDMYVCMYV